MITCRLCRHKLENPTCEELEKRICIPCLEETEEWEE